MQLCEGCHYGAERIACVSSRLQEDWKGLTSVLEERSNTLVMSTDFHQGAEQVCLGVSFSWTSLRALWFIFCEWKGQMHFINIKGRLSDMTEMLKDNSSGSISATTKSVEVRGSTSTYLFPWLPCCSSVWTRAVCRYCVWLCESQVWHLTQLHLRCCWWQRHFPQATFKENSVCNEFDRKYNCVYNLFVFVNVGVCVCILTCVCI